MTTSSFLRHVLRLAGIALAASVLTASSALLPAVSLQASTSTAADPAAPASPAADAGLTADEGVIAYVKRSTGDIHLISPDGTNDRVLWTNPDPDHTPIHLAWRPDGRELAFSSQHEWQCSVYDGDVYAIRSDGTGYRRITNAPACAELAGLPKGSVTVQVMDLFGTSFVYVAGAPGLTRARTGTMTLDNVADFGPGVLQPAVGIAVLDRVTGGPPYADVLPGQTVPGGSLYIDDTSSIRGWGAGEVSWKADGAMLSYNMRTGHQINAIAPVPTYGSMGNALPLVPNASTSHHSWNPTLAGSDQYLYYSTDMKSDEAHGIFLNTVGDASGGTRLYHPPWPLFFEMLDIEWLPDGSGFLFSMRYHVGVGPRLHMRRPGLPHLPQHLRIRSCHPPDHPADRYRRRERDAHGRLARRPAYRLRADDGPGVRSDEQPVDHQPGRHGPAQAPRRCGTARLGSNSTDPSAHDCGSQSSQRKRRRPCVRPHGQWHEFCGRLGRALERECSYDHVRQRHPTDGQHPSRRHCHSRVGERHRFQSRARRRHVQRGDLLNQ